MNANYSKELHVSVPTLDYLKRMTGIDVLLEEGNKERAEAKIMALTARARDYLFINRSAQAQRILSYLIYKGEYENEWLNYVTRYIEATFYYGDESTWTETPRTVWAAIYGTKLQYREFSGRIIHEVMATTEDF